MKITSGNLKLSHMLNSGKKRPMKQQKDVGFAIAGTGMIASIHAAAIGRTPGARLVAVFGRHEGNRRAFAERWQIPFAASTIEELTARPEVDVVCVTTPSGTHLDVVEPLARAGKHVLVEKPLEISAERIGRMVEICRECGVLLGGVFQSRFGPGAQFLKRAVEEGRFGRMVLCSAYVKWYRSEAYYRDSSWKGTQALDGGGALMNQGIHAVDLLGWLAGEARVTRAIRSRRIHQCIEVEDTVVASLQFESGALGVIEATTAAWPGEPKRIEIRGESGAATLEDDRIVTWAFAKEAPEDSNIRAEFGTSNALRSGASDPGGIGVEGHQYHIQNFVNVLKGESTLIVTGEEAARAVRIIEGIYGASGDFV